MKTLVVDASALAAALLDQEAADGVRAAMHEAEGALVAPAVIDLEVANAIRRHTLAGRVPVERGAAAIVNLQLTAISREPHTDLLPRIWELRDNLTPYDAAYVALAEALDAPLLTLDSSLAEAPGHWAEVTVPPSPEIT